MSEGILLKFQTNNINHTEQQSHTQNSNLTHLNFNIQLPIWIILPFSVKNERINPVSCWVCIYIKLCLIVENLNVRTFPVLRSRIDPQCSELPNIFLVTYPQPLSASVQLNHLLALMPPYDTVTTRSFQEDLQ